MLGQREEKVAEELYVCWNEMPQSPGHPFYERLNRVLARHKFDAMCQEKCRRFYAEKQGRPGLAPGIYFRTLLIGYFEGVDSERGIAWRCKDSLSLRSFLGIPIGKEPPDHSTISRTRRLIDLETHQEVFGYVVGILEKEGLIEGKTLGVDATTLEANAAMRSIVRRDTGESYTEFLERLMKASGVETPTREQVAEFDRKRKKTTSNDDWYNPNDPDAAVTKMKDGRTHFGYKAEHGVDLSSGAVVAATIHRGDVGDSQSVLTTVQEAVDRLEAVIPEDRAVVEEVVADKGYHLVMRKRYGFGTPRGWANGLFNYYLAIWYRRDLRLLVVVSRAVQRPPISSDNSPPQTQNIYKINYAVAGEIMAFATGCYPSGGGNRHPSPQVSTVNGTTPLYVLECIQIGRFHDSIIDN
ncbi:MAG TPA: transposase [bacterium]|nr:transposase [bacterium]HQL61699.1 transposase [bacterium]